MRTTLAYVECMILTAVPLKFISLDPMVWVWYSLCIALAFMLRLGMKHKKHELNAQTLLYESICTISWSFISILFWYTFINYEKGFEIYLFMNSLFASFMVSQVEQLGKHSIKQWLRIKLGKFLAVEKEEDKP